MDRICLFVWKKEKLFRASLSCNVPVKVKLQHLPPPPPPGIWIFGKILFKCPIIEGCEGGVLIPFPSKLFFSNPSSSPHNPSLCCSNWNPIPIFLLFLFHESQSQCTKSHFPASKKGKSQLPFYPFTTLIIGPFLVIKRPNPREIYQIFMNWMHWFYGVSCNDT